MAFRKPRHNIVQHGNNFTQFAINRRQQIQTAQVITANKVVDAHVKELGDINQLVHIRKGCTRLP